MKQISSDYLHTPLPTLHEEVAGVGPLEPPGVGLAAPVNVQRCTQRREPFRALRQLGLLLLHLLSVHHHLRGLLGLPVVRGLLSAELSV